MIISEGYFMSRLSMHNKKTSSGGQTYRVNLHEHGC